MQRTNFGRNIRLTPATSYAPETEQDVLEILDRHRGCRIRCAGRLHSWSRAIESNDVLLELHHLNQVEPESEGDVRCVCVGAGCQIKRLLSELQRLKGWTLPSVGFITEQTIAGAVSTGTHGSGRNSLSHYVMSVRIARYDTITGKAVVDEVSSGDALRAARCSLGCLGVILSVRLQCRPAYSVEEHFHEYDQLDDILNAEAKYPLQQFYLLPWRWTYVAQHRREADRTNSKSLSLYHWYRFLVFDISMHLLILLFVRLLRFHAAIRGIFRWIIPSFVIRDWRVSGPSNSQLVMEHELFRHIELELFVSRKELSSAMSFVRQILCIAGGTSHSVDDQCQRQLAKTELATELTQLSGTCCHHYPICVRKILPDDTLISMASSRHDVSDPRSDDAWYSITFTSYARNEERVAFEKLARFLTQSMAVIFSARPHWGKVCLLAPEELTSLYPGFEGFQLACRHYDPDGLFGNDWTHALLTDRKQNQSRVGP